MTLSTKIDEILEIVATSNIITILKKIILYYSSNPLGLHVKSKFIRRELVDSQFLPTSSN